jgi:hypothetical protein
MLGTVRLCSVGEGAERTLAFSTGFMNSVLGFVLVHGDEDNGTRQSSW